MSTAQATKDSHPKLGFFRKYIFSTDHKVIGIQYLVTGFAVAFLAGTLAMLIRLELAWPRTAWPLLGQLFPDAVPGGIISPAFYASLFTMHGTLMVFFFLSVVLIGGFGNYVVPLQIGAEDMAFPFLNALSYWTLVPGILIMVAAFFTPTGAAGSGWVAYPPLSAVPSASPGSDLGQTYWLIGMIFFVASFTMGGINILTTVLNYRAKGMNFLRLPLTTWAIFIASAMGILAFPALTAAVIMLLFDRHLGTSFFLPAGLYVAGRALPNQGGIPLLWQHLFWFLGHPEVYILMLPPMGITSDLLSVFCRKPIFGYNAMVTSLLAIAVLSMVVWGHHMFVSGMSPYLGLFFTVSTIIIAVPSAIKTFNWLATLWGARMQFRVPLLFAIGTVVIFVTGGLSGLFLGNAPVDIHLHDTYFVIAHFHFVMAGAALFGIYGGTYYWFPKMFGKMMNETAGKIHFWLTIVSYYCVFMPMHYLGLHGMMRRLYDYNQYEYLKSLQPVNVFITLGAFLLGTAQLLFGLNFLWSIFRGEKASRNPWQANTLEWQTASPPPHGNWGDISPTVCRWPYDYSYPGAPKDYLPQNIPDNQIQSSDQY